MRASRRVTLSRLQPNSGERHFTAHLTGHNLNSLGKTEVLTGSRSERVRHPAFGFASFTSQPSTHSVIASPLSPLQPARVEEFNRPRRRSIRSFDCHSPGQSATSATRSVFEPHNSCSINPVAMLRLHVTFPKPAGGEELTFPSQPYGQLGKQMVLRSPAQSCGVLPKLFGSSRSALLTHGCTDVRTDARFQLARAESSHAPVLCPLPCRSLEDLVGASRTKN